MIRSLYSAVSGLKNHQVRMDTIGNNISNVNTTAFKASRVNFQDMLSQTIRGASGDEVSSKGMNAAQIGIGTMVATIEPVYTQGSMQYTGRPLDVAISGNGFFVAQDGERQFLTRDGSLSFDKEGYLVNSLGYQVLNADGDTIQVEGSVDSLSIDRFGTITATDSDGIALSEDIQIGLCYVQNPESLVKEGYNLYSGTINTSFGDGDYYDVEAGEYTIGIAGTEGRGILEPMTLESSNVDLTDEFSNMIITQRGYQANARVITTSDAILEELINLKR